MVRRNIVQCLLWEINFYLCSNIEWTLLLYKVYFKKRTLLVRDSVREANLYIK